MAAALAAGLTPQVQKVRGPTPDLDAAFKSMVGERAEALLVLEVPAPIRARERIVELAAAHRMPTMFWGGERGWDAGGLMSYGTGFTSTYPRMPVYVDEILEGWQTCRHGNRSRLEARAGDQPQDRARTGSDHSSRAAETRGPRH